MNTTITLQNIPSSFTDELKLLYRKNLEKGLILAIILHLLVIGIYMGIYYYNYISENENKIIEQRVINVNLTDIEPPPSLQDEEIPPPKIEEILTPPPKDLAALTPEPVAREKADMQTIKTQQQLEEIKTPVSSTGDTGKYSFMGNIKVEDKKIEEKIVKRENSEIKKEQTVYQSFEVEKAPEAVNLEQVKGSMIYPPLALEAQIEGRVTVKVLVDETGGVIKIGSLTGPDIFYDEIREKVHALQFTPGLQNGKPVKVWVTVPFNFRLKN